MRNLALKIVVENLIMLRTEDGCIVGAEYSRANSSADTKNAPNSAAANSK